MNSALISLVVLSLGVASTVRGAAQTARSPRADSASGQRSPPNASSAETLWVGNAAVSGRRLAPYTNLWNLIFVDSAGGKHAAGTVSDRLSGDSARSGIQVRTQMQRAPNGITVTTRNGFDPRTMAPVYRSFEISNHRRVDIAFDSAGVTGSVRDSSGTHPIKLALPRPVFDFEGGLYGLLLRALPLREGYTTTLATLGEVLDPSAGPERAVHFVTVRVTRRERVAAGQGRMLDTWRVEAITHDFGTLIFWLADDPPYIIRAQAPIANGVATYERP